MRVLCVGRHQYISEHLCRIFRDAGADCMPAVGMDAVPREAAAFEPHLLVVQSVLLNPTRLDAWSRDCALRDVPVLAVSLSRRTEECRPPEQSGVAGVVYLPGLSVDAARALIAGARRPRGADVPASANLSAVRQAVAAR